MKFDSIPLEVARDNYKAIQDVKEKFSEWLKSLEGMRGDELKRHLDLVESGLNRSQSILNSNK